MSQAASVPSNNRPYADLPPIISALFEAKARKGLSFENLAKAIGRDEIWVAAAFYGQAKLSPEDIEALARVLDIPLVSIQSELGSHWWPNRGLGPMPPTDPVIYRLYEVKSSFQFGDGIMSMIDCKVNVTKKPDPKGDRVVLTFDRRHQQWKILALRQVVNRSSLVEPIISHKSCAMYVIFTWTDGQSPHPCDPKFQSELGTMPYKSQLSLLHPHSPPPIIMSTSSSEEGSEMVGHSATSSSLESTGSILFSVPSDLSDVQTEITPLTSPTLSEGKMPTPRDILDASRRLGQISASALQGDVTPTKPPKQFYHRGSPESVAGDEAGYDADGDGDADEDINGGNGRTGAGTSATTRPIRRPAFLRIDTRQHKRVASMLAIQRPSPYFGDMDAHTDISHPLRAKLAPLSSIRLKSSGAGAANATAHVESYELRQRRRPNAQPVGLGIGFPENHPLRSRAFTMPIPVTLSPMDDPEPSTGLETRMRKPERRSEWLHASASAVCAPSPVRLALRPTFMGVSPSPIENLPVAAAGAGTFRCDVDVDDHHDRSEVSVRDHGIRRTMMSMSGCDAEIERKRSGLVREVQLDLSKSVVMLPASSAATSTTFHAGSHSALPRNASRRGRR
ncbi:hypothetical protein J3R82DRAFT_11273 [Butyriboletus roseoflavus]|nr:hypothetical protein J3R82DRAFT_11273 [Butyriboletus roseoflavus]